MALIECKDPITFSLDNSEGVTIQCGPLTIADHGQMSISVSRHNVLGNSALLISPAHSCWVTVYRQGERGNLILIPGERNEEVIKLLFSGPDEEKSEMVLIKIGVMSAYTF